MCTYDDATQRRVTWRCGLPAFRRRSHFSLSTDHRGPGPSRYPARFRRRPRRRPAVTRHNPDKPAGLYDAQYEHDACGVAFVADLAGRRDHDIVRKALVALRNLEHRGA